MRVLIFHGYLLRGTGSNVYNASLAQSLAGLGHEVHLLCQDHTAADYDWVDEFHQADGEQEVAVAKVADLDPDEPPRGHVAVHVPDIGGLLPVYVADRYDGFEVKTFPELTDDELDRYLDANVAAVRQVVETYGPPEAALANHLIMGPAILARAGLARAGHGFAIKVHGSDLSYTVRPHPERFVPYAREGTDAASGILVGSGHTAADLFATMEDSGLRDKTRLGPPGVDVARFRPRPRPEADAALEELATRLDAERGESDDSFARNGPAAAKALREWSEGAPRVLSVGKLLVNKGVDLLVAAWPLIHREHAAAAGAGARLLLVGFGAYRPGVEALIEALAEGDVDAARAVAAKGRAYEDGDEGPLPILSRFFENPPPGYAEAAHATAGSILLGGRLEHEEVAEAMPPADVFLMPSTFPEAFGMVPAEAAACGVPPVSADHSGMREVSRQLAEVVRPELAPLLSFEVDDGAVAAIADRVNGWLALSTEERSGIGSVLAARVAALWSWDSVAEGILAASHGELDALPPVSVD